MLKTLLHSLTLRCACTRWRQALVDWRSAIFDCATGRGASGALSRAHEKPPTARYCSPHTGGATRDTYRERKRQGEEDKRFSLFCGGGFCGSITARLAGTSIARAFVIHSRPLSHTHTRSNTQYKGPGHRPSGRNKRYTWRERDGTGGDR